MKTRFTPQNWLRTGYSKNAIIIILAASTVIFLGIKDLRRESPEAYFINSKAPNITLEVADSPKERKKGLMFRKNLREDKGMLFIFSNERNRTFWMKNTFIPLDIIFISKEKRIVDIDEAEPQPNAQESNLKLYRSRKPAKYVIEVNKGFSERFNVEVGSKVKIKRKNYFWNIF